MKLAGRRVHLAGSAAPSTSPEALDYAHNVVRRIATELVGRGTSFLAQVGPEPRAGSSGEPGSAIIFDWTVVEVLGAALRDGSANAAGPTGNLLASVCTHKTEAQIPAERRPLWEELLGADAVRVEHIEGDWTSGAVRRERQAQLADVLIAVSGGEGVEHLAQLYSANGKPVVPLDLNIGSSAGDGKGGASWLNKEALSRPDRFFRLTDPSSGVARLTAAGCRNGQADATQVAKAVTRLLDGLHDPEAFYVRVLSPKANSFGPVEDYFRNVVDPVIESLGYDKAEMGDVSANQAFMNVEIFDRIHHAAIAVVDLTGVRPNCMMELGYAFGRFKRVVLTAQEGTELPFDPAAIDTHFWKLATDNETRIAELLAYCARTASRPPIVKPRGWD